MYGLIGKKLGHSFSADFFNNKFAREGINDHYYLFPLEEISEFPHLLLENPDLEGLNVTIPYKQQLIPYLNSLSEEAEKIGAVNVIKFQRDGKDLKLIGYNSDCIGFKISLLPLLHDKIKKALVLGTGGASKAVSYVLKNLGLEVNFVSRKPGENLLTYEDLDQDIMKENLLIVNTTPLGMFPEIESYPPIPYHFLTPLHVCYDLVYNPLETLFMKKASEQGAVVKNGLEMLEQQALAAWDIWRK